MENTTDVRDFEDASVTTYAPDPPPTGDLCMTLDHVAVAVADLDEAICWYVDNLGFRLIERRRTEGESSSMISAVVVSGAAVVVLIQGVEPHSQVSRFLEAYGPGVQHMAFLVSDMDQALARLAKGGASPAIEVIEEPGIRQVFLTRDDGSGVRIELIEKTGGAFSDRSVQKLFRAFEANDLY